MNTPEFRVNWPKVFKPEKNDLNGKMEYSVTAVFPKGADLSAMKAAAQEALANKFGDKLKDPDFAKSLRNPFRKCKEKWKKDDKSGADIIPSGYEDPDATFIVMRTEQRPAVGELDASGAFNDIIEPRAFYAGCWAVASFNPYAYDQKGNRGVSIGLNNLLKKRDGDPLGGRPSPQSDFAAIGAAASTEGKGAAGLFD